MTGRLAAVTLLLSAVLAPGMMRAQALPTAAGPGSYLAVGGGLSVFQADYGQRKIGGGFVYADMNPTWRYGIEAEARFLRYHTSEDVKEETYLAGLKVAIKPSGFRPYVKFLAGAGHITLPFGYAQGTFLTLAPGGGVDYLVGNRLAVRLDAEYQMWRDFPYGELRPYGASLGISYRINGVDPYPKNGRKVRR